MPEKINHYPFYAFLDFFAVFQNQFFFSETFCIYATFVLFQQLNISHTGPILLITYIWLMCVSKSCVHCLLTYYPAAGAWVMM